MRESNDYRFQTLLLATSLGLLTTAFIVAKTGRDALFFQGKGLFQLPIAYMGIGLASVPAAFLFVQAMKRWGARPSRVGLLAATALSMAAYVPFLEAGNYPALVSFFIFLPPIFGVLFANAWLLASDLFENAPKPLAARCFSRIGASSLVGGMVGGLLSKALAPHLDPKWLVLIGAAIIPAVAGVVVWTHRNFPSPLGANKSGKDREKVTFATTFSKSYARTLLFISMTGALAGLLIDFQFYATASSAKMGTMGNTKFFANFYIMLNLSSLVLQLFVAPKIQDKIGIGGGLLILPLALVGGATFVTAAATALSRSALKVTESGLKSSIHRSIWEQAFIPVDSSERSFVKVFVDGIGARVAEGIGATVLFMWLMGMEVSDPSMLDTAWIAWTILLTAAVWLILTRNLRMRVVQESGAAAATPPREEERDCVRFPEQCPCTTEWGKGIK